MYIKEAVRCAVCGHLLMNKVAELPMEIPSTGAVVYNITAEIKCDKCKSIACYTMMPKKPLDIL